jgi:hypothetical protein
MLKNENNLLVYSLCNNARESASRLVLVDKKVRRSDIKLGAKGN